MLFKSSSLQITHVRSSLWRALWYTRGSIFTNIDHLCITPTRAIGIYWAAQKVHLGFFLKTSLYSPWDSPSQNTGVGSLSIPPGDLPNPGIEPRSPMLQADSLPAEPWRKPRNTGVGSLSLLQGIFLTQESNGGLLHCRWILYQLSYQGSLRCHRKLQMNFLANLMHWNHPFEDKTL